MAWGSSTSACFCAECGYAETTYTSIGPALRVRPARSVAVANTRYLPGRCGRGADHVHDRRVLLQDSAALTVDGTLTDPVEVQVHAPSSVFDPGQ